MESKNKIPHLITVVSFAVFIILGLACATTNKTTVADSADTSKYNYVTIANVMDYGGSTMLMDLEVRIYNALSTTRLNVIGDRQIDSLSESQKEQLLLVRFSASQSDARSVVSINFVDYLTGRPVASCSGSYGMGWSRDHDMRVAIDNAIVQINNLF